MESAAVCEICCTGGNEMLISCSGTCSGQFHLGCVYGVGQVAPSNDWICPQCSVLSVYSIKNNVKILKDYNMRAGSVPCRIVEIVHMCEFVSSCLKEKSMLLQFGDRVILYCHQISENMKTPWNSYALGHAMDCANKWNSSVLEAMQTDSADFISMVHGLYSMQRIGYNSPLLNRAYQLLATKKYEMSDLFGWDPLTERPNTKGPMRCPRCKSKPSPNSTNCCGVAVVIPSSHERFEKSLEFMFQAESIGLSFSCNTMSILKHLNAFRPYIAFSHVFRTLPLISHKFFFNQLRLIFCLIDVFSSHGSYALCVNTLQEEYSILSSPDLLEYLVQVSDVCTLARLIRCLKLFNVNIGPFDETIGQIFNNFRQDDYGFLKKDSAISSRLLASIQCSLLYLPNVSMLGGNGILPHLSALAPPSSNKTLHYSKEYQIPAQHNDFVQLHEEYKHVMKPYDEFKVICIVKSQLHHLSSIPKEVNGNACRSRTSTDVQDGERSIYYVDDLVPKVSTNVVLSEEVLRSRKIEEDEKNALLMEDGTAAYEVESIIDSEARGSIKFYLVKWKGYDMDHNSWEPVQNLGLCSSMIEEYEEKHSS